MAREQRLGYETYVCTLREILLISLMNTLSSFSTCCLNRGIMSQTGVGLIHSAVLH